jgi:hypothetical protein
MQLNGHADFLRPFIWSRAISQCIRQRNSDCASDFVKISEKSAAEILAMIRQAFGEESMSSTWMFEWHAQFRASRTSIEDDQHKGRPISSTTPNTVAKLQQLVHEDRC